RYGLISELLHGCSTELTLSMRLKEAAERIWNHPTQGIIRIKADTLRHWIYRYRKNGIVALEDRRRKDMGTTEIKNSIAERFATLRTEHPHFTSERLLNILLSEGHWNGHRPSRSAFYRFVKIKGLGRKRKDATAIQEASAFAYEAFGNMWVADFLHGPKIRVGRYLKKTYLLAIIDDATRYILYAAFGLSEGTSALIDGLSMAVRRFGIPERFYTDNGAAFRSRHLLHVAAKLSMHLPHTPAYRPQGRGKIERFFRTVREQCLDGIKSESLENLRTVFATWLEEYHHRVHGGIGCSPLNKRLESTRVTRTLPEVAQLDLFFGMQERRKIHRNGTLHLQGKVYDIKNALPGSIVDVYYLPWVLCTIHVGPDRLPAKPVDLLANARRHEHNPLRGKEITP
ncbi:MAG: DDE-type integrase/transposase/recombinase, partial [Saprospiraceae bacterium]|nr:DDE-type integrase/transposase/recombinase [Saprospiraceae bacterium]